MAYRNNTRGLPDVDLSWLAGLLNAVDASKTAPNPTFGASTADMADEETLNSFYGGRPPTTAELRVDPTMPYAGGHHARKLNADYLAQERANDAAMQRQMQMTTALRDDTDAREAAARSQNLTQAGTNAIRAMRAQGLSYEQILQQLGTANLEQAGSMYPTLYGSFAQRGSVAGIPEAQAAGLTASNSLSRSTGAAPFQQEIGSLGAQVDRNQLGSMAYTTALPQYDDAVARSQFASLRLPETQLANNQQLSVGQGQTLFTAPQRNPVTTAIEAPGMRLEGSQVTYEEQQVPKIITLPDGQKIQMGTETIRVPTTTPATATPLLSEEQVRAALSGGSGNPTVSRPPTTAPTTALRYGSEVAPQSNAESTYELGGMTYRVPQEWLSEPVDAATATLLQNAPQEMRASILKNFMDRKIRARLEAR